MTSQPKTLAEAKSSLDQFFALYMEPEKKASHERMIALKAALVAYLEKKYGQEEESEDLNKEKPHAK